MSEATTIVETRLGDDEIRRKIFGGSVGIPNKVETLSDLVKLLTGERNVNGFGVR